MIDKATSEQIVQWLREQPEVESIVATNGDGDECCTVCARTYDPESTMVVEDTGTICFHCLHNLARLTLNAAR